MLAMQQQPLALAIDGLRWAEMGTDGHKLGNKRAEMGTDGQ